MLNCFKGNTPKYVVKSNTLVLNQKCIRNNVIDFSLAQYTEDKCTNENKILRLGDLIINSTGQGTAGRCAYVSELPNTKVTVDSHMLIVRFNNKDLSKFFSYFLYKNEELMLTLLTGSSGQGEFDKERAFNIKFPYCNENKEIFCKIFDAIADKIQLNNKINAELENMAKTLYDYWFAQFDFPDENKRPYKSANGKMVYNEVLKREIPIGWEVKSLYDIATYINGLACQKFRPTDENSYNVIKIKELHTGFNEETEKVKKNIPSKYLVNDGDILFSWSATLEVHMWTGGTGVLNQHIFNVKSKEYPKSFCYYLLNEYVKVFKKIAETRKTTMGHITIDHLKQAYVLVPPLCLISALDNRIKPIFDSIITHRKEQQSLANIRDFLLPLLMNGQVTVSPEH